MIIVMNSGATDEQIDGVVKKIKEAGLDANISRGIERTVIGAIGDERKLEQEMFDALPGVEQAMHIVKHYKIVSRESHKQNTVDRHQGHQAGRQSDPDHRRPVLGGNPGADGSVGAVRA